MTLCIGVDPARQDVEIVMAVMVIHFHEWMLNDGVFRCQSAACPTVAHD